MKKIIWGIILLLAINKSYCYEIATHAFMVNHAYNHSVLAKDISLLQELGINSLDKEIPFGIIYYDKIFPGLTTQLFERTIDQRYSARYMPNEGKDYTKINGWLMFGALREDDVLSMPRMNQPRDDPHPFFRVVQHFFDPYSNNVAHDSDWAALYALSKQGDGIAIQTAVDWAIGVEDRLSPPIVMKNENTFSIHRAMESMYIALTGHDYEDNAKFSIQNKTLETMDEQRKAHWATVFRSLGDAVHLLQDMAQPQHTRSDIHNADYGREGSWYEWYIEQRVWHNSSLAVEIIDDDGKGVKNGQLNVKTLEPVVFEGYQPESPTFKKFRDYFTTEDGESISSGKGLADYSNRGFFTSGTNFGSSKAKFYPFPSNNISDYKKVDVNNNYSHSSGKNLKTTVLKATVIDNLGENSEADLTTKSVFSIGRNTTISNFSMSQLNLDDMAKLLIPRAVSYSTGLIDFFFRGRLAIQEIKEDCGELKIKIKNTSKTGNHFYNGKFSVAYDATDGTRKLLPIISGGEITEAEAISPWQSHEIIADYPYILDRDEKKQLVVVFKGIIGQEQGVAAYTVKAEDVPEYPDGFIVTPKLLPDDGISGSRLLVKEPSGWKLCKTEGWAAGSFDWKGHYKGGKPTKSLTIAGPVRRYSINGSGASKQIMQFGKVWATAPCPVYGTSLYIDSDEKEWLVAVCLGKVYRKLNASFADQGSEPANEWQLLKDFEANSSVANDRTSKDPKPSVWYFNGDGTTAKNLYTFYNGTQVTATITINDDEISFSEQKKQLGEYTATYEETSNCSGPNKNMIKTNKSSGYEVLISLDYANNSLIKTQFKQDSSEGEISYNWNFDSTDDYHLENCVQSLCGSSGKTFLYAQLLDTTSIRDNIAKNVTIGNNNSHQIYHHNYTGEYTLDSLRDESDNYTCTCNPGLPYGAAWVQSNHSCNAYKNYMKEMEFTTINTIIYYYDMRHNITLLQEASTEGKLQLSGAIPDFCHSANMEHEQPNESYTEKATITFIGGHYSKTVIDNTSDEYLGYKFPEDTSCVDGRLSTRNVPIRSGEYANFYTEFNGIVSINKSGDLFYSFFINDNINKNYISEGNLETLFGKPNNASGFLEFSSLGIR